MPADVAVLIPTWRVDIIDQTIQRLTDGLIYAGKIKYFIGNDNEWTTSQIVEDTVRHCIGANVLAVLDGPRRTRKRDMTGYLGANINRLYAAACREGFQLFIQMDDDHHLIQRLDINPHVCKLETDETVGWIRLMGVSFHNYCGCLDGMYWRVRWDSPEVYIASNRPHIKHKRFHDSFGMYLENLKLGATEERFNHMCKDKARQQPNMPQVLVPLDVHTESGWLHVGQSLQLQGE